MSEKPVIFSTPMVKAILDFRKTVTRRVIKLPDIQQNNLYWQYDGEMSIILGEHAFVLTNGKINCDYYYTKPRYQKGDLLWVKETYLIMDWANRDRVDSDHSDIHIQYKASDSNYRPDSPRYIGHSVKKRCPNFIDNAAKIFLREIKKSKNPWQLLWISARFMPKFAARIWLEVLDVRPERLQEITLMDITKEGIDDGLGNRCPDIARHNFKALWDSLNAKRGYSWESNPWVWRYEFKRIKP